MKYIILGAGWAGCFIGMLFRILNIDFIILEKERDILKGSISHNYDTIHNIGSFLKDINENKLLNGILFKKLFNYFTIGTHNTYHIVTKKCSINMENANNLLKKHHYEMKNIKDIHNIKTDNMQINNILKYDDKIIKLERVISFIKEFLKDKIICEYDSTKLSHNDKIKYNNYNADFLIDCTNGTFDNRIDKKCIILVYNTTNHEYLTNIINIGINNRLTIVPYKNNKILVVDYEYGVIDNIYYNETSINAKIQLINNKITKYLPEFGKHNTFETYHFSNICNTECKIYNKIIKVRCEDIQSIFEVYDNLFNILDDLKVINNEYIAHEPSVISRILNFYGRPVHEQEIIHHSKNTRNYAHIKQFIYELINCQEFIEKCIIPTLKVAVLFFGYTRDLKKNYEKHKQLLRWNPDIFIHTYDSSGKKSKNKNVKWIESDELSNKVDFNFIMEKYNPIKIKIEKNTLDELSIKDGKLIPVLIYQAKDDATRYINSQLYTRKEVVALKNEYENLKKFKYDIVLLTRFDFGFDKFNMHEILRMDMSRIYFPGFNSHHSHPGKGGGCTRCDINDIHFGEPHKNDFCDVWTLSNSENIDVVGKLFDNAKDILYRTREKTYEYVIKNNIKHSINSTILFIYSDFEHNDVVCYYPERLLREYLREYICLTYNGINGMITKIE
ncbi:hypothetical protein QKU48_gp1110 [Fadolivirus algeromassiliense]|jgi:hypothetical protein|uniref:Uncharacterized protein n=1 Tax=Fadolivirus FV1/VV64 TaxID=3070911 RepID=A0A7D3UQN3_9VIRU|nr:hypothetical protein QKU48_gp1110 [Fadolivirus algeromassiliense]QKF94568.1 hypothetical protein Fadolivirus_1_1110 [Fadolivirus FV1/VV64]